MTPARLLRPCSFCTWRLTFAGICAECLQSRQWTRHVRSLVVAVLRSFGCK